MTLHAAPSLTHPAYEVMNAEAPGPWVVTCDHASNAVPDWVAGGDLGLPPWDMARHIAYDVGAAGLGPYRQGRDAEYTWYPDADGDGVACP